MGDEVVSGELVPDPRENRRVGDLKPIPGQVGPECRALALSLRELFGAVGVSLRVYATRTHHDPGTVSRYLNGTVVAPATFVEQLFVDAGKATGRPVAAEVLAHVHRLQRTALQATNSVGYELQMLRDQLADADRERQRAETVAEALTEALQDRKARIAEMEVDQRRLAASVSIERAEYDAELARRGAEEQRLRGERDRLRAEVARLQQELDQARRQAVAAEQRCEALEHQLQTAEEAAEPGDLAQEPYAELLDRSEELRLAAERRARELQEELEALRAERARAAERDRVLVELSRRTMAAAQLESSAAGDGIGETEHSPVVRFLGPDAPEFTVVHAAADAPWAEWIAHRLEAHGQQAVLRRWYPTSFASAQDLLPSTDGLTILLLSDPFFDLGTRAGIDWSTVISTIRGTYALRVRACEVAGTTHQAATALAPLGLGRLSGEAATERALLRHLGLPVAPGRVPGSPGGARYPLDPPAVWEGVPHRDPHFSGREELLTQLRQRFGRESGTASVCALVGMPGIGKSQLAAEYAHRFAAHYDLVWWVAADTRARVREELARLGLVLGRDVGGALEDRISAASDALREGRPYRRWLIVLDGADDFTSLADLLPAGTGDVLVTSQSRAWVSRHDVVDVPLFTRAESTAYLHRFVRRVGADGADALAEALGDLPLLLGRAARHLDVTALPVTDYVARFSGTEGTGTPADTGQIFAPALNRLAERSPRAHELLCLCAMFHDGTAPLDVLRPIFRGVDCDVLVRSVVQMSLLSRDTTREGVPIARMHPALRAAVRQRIPAEDREGLTGRIRAALRDTAPGDHMEPEYWPWYAAVIPQLEATGALNPAHKPAADLVLECLSHLHFRGRVREGLRLAERADRMWRSELGELGSPHPKLAAFVGRHTALLRAAGEFERAEQLDRAELERQRLVHGAGAEDLRVMGQLSNDLQGLGRYTEALELSLARYEGRRELFGEHHPATLNARLGLADSLRLLGRHKEARRHSRACAAAFRARSDLGHRVLRLLAEQRLSLDLRLKGDYTQALDTQTPVAEALRAWLGPDNPYTLAAEHELALCELRCDRVTAGLDRLRAAHKGAEKLLGRHAPLTLMALANRAAAEKTYVDRQGAERLTLRAVDGYRAALGAGHPYTVGVTANHETPLRPTFEALPF
ncbi:FxSxx-COOH system tetratricopeptide repeat protein [Streptomyces sp. XD-27]|uniref:FxSxx-COOH system tetratricopeptide repeat protein n=1 Tax=Streptomyces sp. XD-27 TaxID=3062779 RepID=UPI0026F44CB6|nr:FxSxx-COOH system tetratricopeptide repeat protein [Streptomyces sp. XD-27]WKX72547.1 FxSxx-COOH system tetratricopeptide repeat protein [Streptomyces sp. XD-27]